MRISDWSSDVCSSDLLLRRDDLRDCRAEFGVDQRADVELAGLEHGDDALADGGRLVEGERRLGDILDGADDQRAVIAAKLVSALSADAAALHRSEEHTSELQSLMRISYAFVRLKKKNTL